MGRRPDARGKTAGASAAKAPKRLGEVSLGERWAPLVKDPDHAAPQPPRMGARVLTAALCLGALALILWVLG